MDNNENKNSKTSGVGGKVLASGGFGCVFSPALKCEGETKRHTGQISKLMSLNLPNGGLPVDDYIYANGSYEKLYNVHTSIVKLLKKGIIPMNEKFVFHCDIKDSNVLIDDSSGDLKARLIDWGLSTEYTPFKDEPFPKSWRNRPLQFNVPFSVIIFSDSFVEKYTKFIKDNGIVKNPEEIELKPFVFPFLCFTLYLVPTRWGH